MFKIVSLIPLYSFAALGSTNLLAVKLISCEIHPGQPELLKKIEAAKTCEMDADCIEIWFPCPLPINKAHKANLIETKNAMDCVDGIGQCLVYLPGTYEIGCVNKECKYVPKSNH